MLFSQTWRKHLWSSGRSLWELNFKLILTLLVSAAASVLIWSILWKQHMDLLHSALELVSICIGIATFLIIFSRPEEDDKVNCILGFGFLAVSVFDFIHTFYYSGLLMKHSVYGELSMRFWLLARLVEVLVLFVFSCRPSLGKISKRIMAIQTILVICSFYCITYMFPNLIPPLSDGQGVTILKVALEYLVIVLASMTLFKIYKNLKQDFPIKFQYLYMCVFLIIPSEICFTLFSNLGSFWMVFGLVLKICSYYYLYKAVFQSLINYPYDRLGENNQRLADILNSLPIGILTYNSNNDTDFLNSKFEELFKYPAEKIIGLRDEEVLQLLLKKEDNFQNGLANLVDEDSKNTGKLIKTYFDSNSKEVKVLVDVHKISGGALVLAGDIKQEQEIRNLNLQAQIILDAMLVPTIILDNTGDIVACNTPFTELVDIEYKNIVGINIENLKDIVNSSDKQNRNLFELLNKKINERDFAIETPKGNKRQIRAKTSLITNIYNENIGVLIVAHDMSKLKEEQGKIINQEKLALLGQMGAAIVHETRNFLTTIKGNSQLIETFTQDEKLKAYAKKINADTDEVNRIISDFLSLSKPRETEFEEVAFNDLVLCMKSTIETSSLMNRVELILDLDYDERYMLCDETQVRQIILNICKNAVEAMEGVQKPILKISTGLDELRGEVFIKITDNGIGMDKETLKKIGKAFFTTKKTGTGLGLNVCYQIIKEHKGRIEVESELGKGTMFKITLPYLEEDFEEVI